MLCLGPQPNCPDKRCVSIPHDAHARLLYNHLLQLKIHWLTAVLRRLDAAAALT